MQVVPHPIRTGHVRGTVGVEAVKYRNVGEVFGLRLGFAVLRWKWRLHLCSVELAEHFFHKLLCLTGICLLVVKFESASRRVIVEPRAEVDFAV